MARAAVYLYSTYIRTRAAAPSAMAWPFHCADAAVAFKLDGPNGTAAAEVTYFKERDADMNRLAPLHRAVYTYATWADRLPPAWGRAAPAGGAMLAEELRALGDAARHDGTCTVMTDATMSAISTAYNPSGDTPVVTVDFAPCLKQIATSASVPTPPAPWFEPTAYAANGWVYRFTTVAPTPASPANCSMEFIARRNVPAGATGLTVVEVASATGCAAQYCAGAGGPLVTYGSDAIVRRATRRLIDGSFPQDVWVNVTTAEVRRIAGRSRQTVRGSVAVADPLFWPGVTGVALSGQGPCDVAAGPLQLAAGRWVGPLTMGCDDSPTRIEQAVALTTTPWGAGVWVRGGARALVANVSAVPTEQPPRVGSTRAAPTVALHGTSSVRFGLDPPFDEAYWEVVSAQAPVFAVSPDVVLTAPPPPECADQPFSAAPSVSVANGGVTVGFVNTLNPAWDGAAPLKVAACLTVGVAPVTPVAAAAWPVWRSAAAAARFSKGGGTQQVDTDAGDVGYLSTSPQWDDGGAAAAPAPGYPYRAAVDLTPALVAATSPWVGLLSTVAAPANVTGTGGRSQLTPAATVAPPPPAAGAPLAAPTAGPAVLTITAIAFMAGACVLLIAAIVLLIVAVCYRSKRGAKKQEVKSDGESSSDGEDDGKEEEEEEEAEEEKETPEVVKRPSSHHSKKAHSHHSHHGGPRRVSRIMVMLAMPCLASACTQRMADACAACAGTLSPSTCDCSCGWSKAEAIAYSMLLFPATLMMLLYV